MIRGLTNLHDAIFSGIEGLTVPLMTTLARFLFAAILLMYFWNSGLTKLGDGILGFLFPSDGAYIQVFPRTVEAAGYDFSQLGTTHWVIVTLGMWAEFILPLLVAIGLFTRLAAFGMIGFIAIQSWVDLFGHGGISNGTLGGWFDRFPDGLILDQRAFWIFVLLYLVLRGGGPLSVDRIFRNGSLVHQGDRQPTQV